MKKISVVTLLVCIAVLAGCASVVPPQTEAERNAQKQAEEQRRIKADHFAR
jgi:uncharacterized protein YceK